MSNKFGGTLNMVRLCNSQWPHTSTKCLLVSLSAHIPTSRSNRRLHSSFEHFFERFFPLPSRFSPQFLNHFDCNFVCPHALSIVHLNFFFPIPPESQSNRLQTHNALMQNEQRANNSGFGCLYSNWYDIFFLSFQICLHVTLNNFKYNAIELRHTSKPGAKMIPFSWETLERNKNSTVMRTI